jgi:hypothetical protein
VVVDAAAIEPVSTGQNSLLTGKRTGNFVESGSVEAFSRFVCQQIQSLAAKFPAQRNSEFAKPYHGILRR